MSGIEGVLISVLYNNEEMDDLCHNLHNTVAHAPMTTAMRPEVSKRPECLDAAATHAHETFY